jgi:hypothetical protein
MQSLFDMPSVELNASAQQCQTRCRGRLASQSGMPLQHGVLSTGGMVMDTLLIFTLRCVIIAAPMPWNAWRCWQQQACSGDSLCEVPAASYSPCLLFAVSACAGRTAQ